MLRMCYYFLLFLIITGNLFSQVIELPPQQITAKTINLEYPVNAIDVSAIGMGNTGIANSRIPNALIYNPAFLGHENNYIEYFGIMLSMPSDTWKATSYLSDHIEEFEEALSLNQIWDAIAEITAADATNLQKLAGLHDIQDGLVFINDLVDDVTGPADNPKVHGTTIIPGARAQFGNFGFSIYGFAQTGFLVQLSPTFESLQEVDIPNSLRDPVAIAKAIIQLKAALAPAIIGPREFSDKVFPTAYYSSYMDLVATAGYGMPVNENLMLGANLKIINRRFLLDRIPVRDYDEIISSVWQKFKSDVTGITCDLGAHYKFSETTSAGVTMQNIIPLQEIRKTVKSEFRFHRIEKYDISNDGKIDSLRYLTWEATVTRPFVLKVPFFASLGLNHSITSVWDIALDWVDIAENDTRFEESADRIRLGTEYRYSAIENSLTIIPRLGLADQRLTAGLGFNIINKIHIDGAYAYDRFVNEYAIYTQLKIGW